MSWEICWKCKWRVRAQQPEIMTGRSEVYKQEVSVVIKWEEISSKCTRYQINKFTQERLQSRALKGDLGKWKKHKSIQAKEITQA